MKKTQQKISLSDEMFAKLKDYAIAVAYHRKQPTSWGDILRMLAAMVIDDCPPEKFCPWVESVTRRVKAEKAKKAAKASEPQHATE
jgi:hypothetical protein